MPALKATTGPSRRLRAAPDAFLRGNRLLESAARANGQIASLVQKEIACGDDPEPGKSQD
jgi:hypothetical protein